MAEDNEITDGEVRRLKNLRLYKDYTDEQIREVIRNRKVATKAPPKGANKSYEKRFDEKLKILQDEFGVDMNTANDEMMVHNLIRQMLQAEDTNNDIRAIQEKEFKTKENIYALKALGEFQRDIQITIADLQDKLGITRKVRKEKAVDDIPQFIDSLLKRADSFWQRKTLTVECPKCEIELVRYWLNFPDETTMASFTTKCPHCGETVTANR